MSHPDGTVSWRLQKLEHEVAELERKVDRLTWALSVAAVTFGTFALTLLLTYFGQS